MKRRTNNAFNMKEGSLYPMLHSLENSGAVESYFYDSPEGRRRKYYKITKKGRKMLEVRKDEWKIFADIMNSILNGGKVSYA